MLLYKGHRTLIAAPDGALYRNHSGNPGMAKGGCGDVLAGMLTALCGQGIPAVQAACAAAWLHGRAGDLAANTLSEYGMTPVSYTHLDVYKRQVKRGVPEKVAASLFDEIMDFANYAFNKAHAVCYAVVSFRTAYLKCHYPLSLIHI